MQAFIIIFILINFAFFFFVIYFIFKSLQFVIQAVNLYKKMIDRLDANLNVLLDIRDNTKNYKIAGSPNVKQKPISRDEDNIYW